MKLESIANRRLHNQRITQAAPPRPDQLVAWLGAVQAQEYEAAKWALGLRIRNGVTASDIEAAVNEGRLVRTHVMRPTWHFVAAADIQWMLELTAPRVHQALKYARKNLELSGPLCTRATTLIERAVRDGEHLTRAELGACLARGKVAATGIRLAMLTIYAELEGVVCSGPRRGTQHTYTLLAARAPRAKHLSRDEALAELTGRYVKSHGPATIRDLVWWSGLTSADARRGLEASGARGEAIDGHTYWTSEGAGTTRSRAASVRLLPIYDEYLVAYRDHHAVPRGTAGGGMLPQALIAGGHVAGTWKALPIAGGVVVEVKTQRPLTGRERQMLEKAVTSYGEFLQKDASLRIVAGERRAR